MSHYPEQYKIGEDIQIECTNDGPNAPYQYGKYNICGKVYLDIS